MQNGEFKNSDWDVSGQHWIYKAIFSVNLLLATTAFSTAVNWKHEVYILVMGRK